MSPDLAAVRDILARRDAGWGHSFRWHLDVIEAYEQQAVGA